MEKEDKRTVFIIIICIALVLVLIGVLSLLNIGPFSTIGEKAPGVISQFLYAAGKPQACIDSDNGLNYTVFGTCTYGSTRISDSCSNGLLVESYCKNVKGVKSCAVSNYNCANLGANYACLGGACVVQGCTNECASGARQCFGNGYQTCGNYDADSCLEWSSVTSCSAGQTCSGGNCISSCTPSCTGKVCGDDGCGGSCGNCSADQMCSNGNCVASSGNTYYVSKLDSKCNDSGPGNSTMPWCNLSRAYTWYAGTGPKVTDGDTIKLRTGNYGAFDETGKPHANWITYEADSGNFPVFTSVNIYSYPAIIDSYIRLNGISVDAASSETGCDITGVRHVEMLNMKIIGKGYSDVNLAPGYNVGIHLKDSSNILVNNSHIYGTGTQYAAKTSVSGQPGILFANGFRVGIQNAQGHDCQNIIINNCEINGNDVGIVMGGSNWTVSNNNIHHCSTDGIDLGPSNTASSGLTAPMAIINNSIHNLGWFGDFYSDHCDFLQFNYVTTPDADINHIKVQNNIMYDSDQQGWHIKPFPSAGSHDWIFENNLLYNINLQQGNNVAIAIQDAAGIVFRNNTVGGNGGDLWGGNASGVSMYSYTDSVNPSHTEYTSFYGNIIPQVTFGDDYNPPVVYDYEDHNIFRSVWLSPVHILGNHSILINNDLAFTSIFVNYATNDFRPLMSSAACNGSINPRGVSVGALACVNGTAANTYYVSVTGAGTHTGLDIANAMNFSDARYYSMNHPSISITFLLADGNYGGYREVSDSGSNYETNVFNRTAWHTWKNYSGGQVIFSDIKIGKSGQIVQSYLAFDGITVTPGYNGGLEDAIKLYNTNYINLININLIGDGFTSSWPHDYGIDIDHSNNVKITGCNISGNSTSVYKGFEKGVGSTYSHNILVENCEVADANIGVEAYGYNWTIRDNYLHNLTSDGVLGTGISNSIIDNNRIENMLAPKARLVENPLTTIWNASGMVMTNPNSKWNTSGDTQVYQNWELYVISGNNVITGDNDVGVVSVSNTQIILNKGISSGGLPLNVNYTLRSGSHSDGIQLFNADGAGATGPNVVPTNNISIKNNTIHGSTGQCVLWNGFSTLYYSSNISFVGNLMYDCGGYSFWAEETNGLVVENNTILDNYGGLGSVIFRGNKIRVTSVRNNIMGLFLPSISEGVVIDKMERNVMGGWANWPQQSDVDYYNNMTKNQSLKNIVLGNNFQNVFVNYSTGDFRPIMTSAACDGSINPPGVAVGKLPCACTNNSQCVQVFGSGTCNLATGRCSAQIPSFSPFARFWEWLKSFF